MTDQMQVQQKISHYAAEDPVVRLALQKRPKYDFQLKDSYQRYIFYLGVDLIRDIDKTYPNFLDIFGEAILLDKLEKAKTGQGREKLSETYRFIYPDGIYLEIHVMKQKELLAYATKKSLIDSWYLLVDKETEWPVKSEEEDEKKTPIKERRVSDSPKRRLTQSEFDMTVDEFFIQILDVSKDLMRSFPYGAWKKHCRAMEILEVVLDEYLHLEGYDDLGDDGDQYFNYLEQDYRDLLKKSVPSLDPEEEWTALFDTSSLFRKICLALNEKGYDYAKEMDVQMVQVLRKFWQNKP